MSKRFRIARLAAEGLTASEKEERCETCGLTEWRGAALAMALHHVNGDRLANLRMLCPNCHAQTDS